MGSIFGGGGSSSSSSSSQVATLPNWIQGPLKDLVSQTGDLIGEDFQSYNDPRFADFTQDEQAAFGLTRNLVNQNGFDVSQSQDIANQVAQRGLEGYSQEELQQYMNPYTENVLDVNRRRQFENFEQNQNQFRQRASQAGAFGGSRFGLGEAQMNQDFQQQLSDFDQQGLYTAYNEGMNRANQGTQMAGQAGMDLANLANVQQTGSLRDAGALQGIGTMQRGLTQQGLDFDFQEFNREQAHPYQQLQFASGIYNPIGSLMRGSETTQTQVQDSGDSGFLGAAVGLGSLALGLPGVSSAIGSSLGGGALGGGLASLVNGQGRSSGAMGPFQTPNSYGRYNDGGIVTPSDHGANFMDQVAQIGASAPMPQPLQPAPLPAPQEGGDDGGGGLGNILGMAMKFAPMAMGMPPIPFADGGIIPDMRGSDPYGGVQPLPMPQLQALAALEQRPSDLEQILLANYSDNAVPQRTPDFNPDPNERTQQVSEADGYNRNALQKLWASGLFGEEPDHASGTRDGKAPTRTAQSKDYFDVLADVESSNNPKAVNKNSGAAGLYQFLPATAKQYGLKDPHNPKQARKAVEKFTKDNAKVLKKTLDREPTDPELYLAHQQGAGGASKLLANPTKKAKDIVGSKAVTQNGGTLDMTAHEFANMWMGKFHKKQAIPFANGGVVPFGGGDMTPFQRALQQRVGNPIRSGLDALTGHSLDMTKAMQEAGQYFTQSESDYYKNEPTMLDNLVDDAKLNLAEKKLQRGQMPQNLQKMMGQVGPLAQAGAQNVTLDPLQNKLMVNEGLPSKPAPQQVLMDAVTQATGKPTAPQRPQAPAPQTVAQGIARGAAEKAPQKKGANLPLMMFGAQLLSSNKGFLQATGEGAKAGIQTKMQLDNNQAKAQQAQAQQALKQRNSDLQAQRVAMESQRLNTELPYTAILKDLELQQKLKSISGEKDIQKAIDDLAKTLIENTNTDAETAYRQASQIILSNRVGENLNNPQANKPAAVSIEDFLAN